MRKLTLILTLAILILALTAGMALAAPASSIYVDGEQIWNGAAAYNNAVSGVTYDSASNTLTLDGAKITQTEPINIKYCGIYAEGDLKIELKGYNSIDLSAFNVSGTDYGSYRGITVTGKLSISGGELAIRSGDDAIFADEGLSIDSSRLTLATVHYGAIITGNNDIMLSDSVLDIDANGYGIYAGHAGDGNLTIDNSVLNIKAGSCALGAGQNHGDASGSVTIKDSQLTISQGEIYARDDIAIKDSRLSIKEAGLAVNTRSGGVTIDNSQLTISAVERGISANGLYELPGRWYGDEEFLQNSVKISNSDVRIEATELGIEARGIIELNNSYVYSDGGVAGIVSWFNGPDRPGITYDDGSVVIQGGKVVEIWGMREIYSEDDYEDYSLRAGATIDRSSGKLLLGQVIGETEDEEEQPEYESVLLGHTFCATGQRVNEEKEWVDFGDGEGFDVSTYPGASQIVEIIRFEQAAQLVMPILGGVGKNFPFVDVGLNHWAYNDIFDAFKKGLINGKTETLYLPDGPLTYAEAIKLAACIHQLNSMGAVSFERSDPWYQTYVSYAELNQIILPGEFAGKYNDAIIRYDFAHIFGKALPLSAFTPLNAINSLPDVPSSNRHADEILMLYRAGILVGSDAAGTFNGNSNIKRSEVAAIVVCMIDPARRIVK